MERIFMEAVSCLTIETEEKRWTIRGEEAVKEEEVRVSFEKTPEGIKVFLEAEKAKVRSLKLRWKRSAPGAVRILGDAWERGYGDLEWKGMQPERILPWYFLESSEKGLSGYGVKVRPAALCFWQVDPAGITLLLDVRCGGDGVCLGKRKLEVCEIVCAQADPGDAMTFAEAFCRMMCTDPIFPDHPVYGANNWYYAYGVSSEEEILADTDALMELCRGFENPPYMVIDDCWQKLRSPAYIGGPWSEGNERFPDMQRLAEKIEEKGARPGIWLRFLLNRDERIRPEWKLMDSECLDPTHPEALEWIREDVRRTCSWGYKLIKHDFSTFDLFGKWGFEMNPWMTRDGWHFYDQSRTSAEAVRMLYEAIYEAARPFGTLVLGCNTIGHLGAGWMHMDRTGDDTSGKNWERTRVMGINTLAFRLCQHKTFFDVDADCVGIMGKIPWRFNRQWADVIAQSGTALFISAKPGVLQAEEKEELRQILRIASTGRMHKKPADWMETTCPRIWEDDRESRVYDWFEEEGAVMECKKIRYETRIPLS